MANTVSQLTYNNTFGDWVVNTNALAQEINNLGGGVSGLPYTKDSGILILNGVGTGLSVAYGATVGGQLVAGSANVTYNLWTGGQTYLANTGLSLVTYGTANIGGLLLANGPGNGLIVANNTIHYGTVSVLASGDALNVSNNVVVGARTTSNNLSILSDAQINNDLSVVNTTFTNSLRANNNIYTVTSAVSGTSFTNVLQANTSTNTATSSVTGTSFTNVLQANTSTNTATSSVTGTSFTNILQANTSTNTATSSVTGTSYTNTLQANTVVTAPKIIVSSLVDANSATAYFGNIITNQQLSVGGNFVINGATVYNANTFTLNSSVTTATPAYINVSRGISGANASIRWNEINTYWDVLDVNSGVYSPLMTSNTLASSSVTIALNNSISTLNSNVSTLNVYATSAYARANTSANSFVGTTGSATPTAGIVNLTSGNGVTAVGSGNTITINTAQDIRTTASPAFNALSLVNALPLAYGGTGAQSAGGALTNILPAGTTAGYVLTTGGVGSYYWAAGSTGGGSGAVPGTTINSSRLNYTATAGQTLFTAPSYLIGSSQLRVYVDGVRQYPSDYTETSNTSVTLLTGAAVNDTVMIEVDGYVINPYYANNIGYTINSGISSTANTIQLAIDGLYSVTAPKISPQLTGVPLAVTPALTTSNTMIATTGFVYGALANTAATYTHNISGTATNITGTYAGTITSSQVTTGLGFTPYNSTNPTGYQTAAQVSSAISSGTAANISGTYAGTITSSQVTTGLGFTPYNSTNPTGYQTAAQVSSAISSGTAATAGTTNATNTANSFQMNALGVGVSNAVAGTIVASGNITAYSDARLKENVNVIPNSLEKVKSIRGVTFTRNDKEDSTKLYTGVIAQEVLAVLPEVVFENADGIYSVDYGNMVGLLIEAIKDLSKEIDILKGNI